MDPGSRKILRSVHVGIVGLLVLILRYGVPLRTTAIDVLLGLIGLCYLLSILLPAGRSRPGLRARILEDSWVSFFTALFLVFLCVFFGLGLSGSLDGRHLVGALRTGARLYVALVSLKIVTSRIGAILTTRVSTALVPVMTFALVIACGTAMLALPEAAATDISFLNRAFTATSATCVTGLIVQDTGQDYELFGQMVILLLIQVGGLGLMTFVAFFALFLGHSVGLRESVSLSTVMDSEFIADLKRTLAHIIFWTLSIEAVGALLLYVTWKPLQMQTSVLDTVWHAVFHSVSSFCNAGFSLNTANMEPYASSPATCVVMGSLIVLGGLGFSVLAGLSSAFLTRVRERRRPVMPVHVRLVLVMTAVLVIATMLFFLACEWDNTLKGMSTGDRIANSFLESVTPRTAGFNTVPTNELRPATKWVFTALMFIGASPGGTGGGVKTTTVALLLLTALAILRRRSSIDIWHRRIAPTDVMRAASVFVLACFVVAFSVTALLLTERGALASVEDGSQPSDYIFESLSAFGTVGLSTGVTGKLTPAGRLVIMLTMFLGRIGPLTLAVASGRFLTLHYTYPEARVTIG